MRYILALLFILPAGLAHAEWTNRDRNDFAEEMAGIVIAEEVCGFQYDQNAIAQYIGKVVPEGDMKFTGELRTRVEYNSRPKSETEKTIFCTQNEKVAKSHGFLQ